MLSERQLVKLTGCHRDRWPRQCVVTGHRVVDDTWGWLGWSWGQMWVVTDKLLEGWLVARVGCHRV